MSRTEIQNKKVHDISYPQYHYYISKTKMNLGKLENLEKTTLTYVNQLANDAPVRLLIWALY